MRLICLNCQNYLSLLPLGAYAASVLYFKKFPFCHLGQTLECLSHLNPGFKKEWELAAKCHLHAASLNIIMLSRALPGLPCAECHRVMRGLWQLTSSACKSAPRFWSGITHREVQHPAWRSWQLVVDECVCFCGSTHSSWDTGKNPAGYLHPSQGDVFTDPPPLSNFMQRVRGCANAVFRTAAPQCAGAAYAECL